ncbi:MAG: hypothetical protein ACRD6X_22255, partial [Pyrinomonadaceae bacterium]
AAENSIVKSGGKPAFPTACGVVPDFTEAFRMISMEKECKYKSSQEGGLAPALYGRQGCLRSSVYRFIG